jgi:hypothetical protein
MTDVGASCAVGWEVDPWARFSECTIPTDLLFYYGCVSIFNLVTILPLTIFAAYITRINARVASDGFCLVAASALLIHPFFAFAVYRPHESALSKLWVAVASSIGTGLFFIGAGKISLEHAFVLAMEVAMAFDRKKIAQARLQFRRTSVLCFYLLLPLGTTICFLGVHLARNEDEADVAITIGIAILALTTVPLFAASSKVRATLIALVHDLNPSSTSTKTISNFAKMMNLAVMSTCNCFITYALLAFVPWLRRRSGIIYMLVLTPPVVLSTYTLSWHYIFQMRQLEKVKGKINISVTNDKKQMSIDNVINATKQDLASAHRVRRAADASQVMDSGVSLAFLEAYYYQNKIAVSSVCNDVVNAHVKPHTKEIGTRGSGAYVELIQDGVDAKGRSWCKTPTHMLSYSWLYTLHSIIETLRVFELEYPPRKGNCHYYFIDQFAIDQHASGSELTNKECGQEWLLKTLEESIIVPGKVICMLHPWGAPIVLKRVWCLFELYLAIVHKCELFMCFPPTDAAAFYDKLVGGIEDGGTKALVPKIDVTNAGATLEADRLKIMGRIEDTIGLDSFNKVLQANMDAALQQVATSSLLVRGPTEKLSKTLFRSVVIHNDEDPKPASQALLSTTMV